MWGFEKRERDLVVIIIIYDVHVYFCLTHFLKYKKRKRCGGYLHNLLYFYATHRLKQNIMENRKRDVVVTYSKLYNVYMQFYATHILK